MVPIVVIAEPNSVRARYLQDDLVGAGITDLAVNVGGLGEAQSFFEDIASAIGDEGPLHVVLFISADLPTAPSRRLLEWIRCCERLRVRVAVLDPGEGAERHSDAFDEHANAHFVKFPTVESLAAFVFGGADRQPQLPTASNIRDAGESSCALEPRAVCT